MSGALTSLLPAQYGPAAFPAQKDCGLRSQAPLIECMSNDAREGQNREGQDRGERDREGEPAGDDSFEARLRRARERRRADAGFEPRPPGGTDASGIARGFRLSSELVGAVLLGGAIGWLLDRWLGISPWGMIVFLLLGFAAGVLNVMRAAGIVPPQTMHPPPQD